MPHFMRKVVPRTTAAGRPTFFSRRWRWLIVKDVEVTQRVNTPRAPVHLVNEMFCVTRITVRAVCTMRPILFWNGFDYNYPACIPRANIATMHPHLIIMTIVYYTCLIETMFILLSIPTTICSAVSL